MREKLTKLLDAGVYSIYVEYNGYGDEGDIGNVIYRDKEGNEIQDIDGKFLVHDDVYDWLHNNYGGWDQNEGSSGNITIDVALGKIEINHGWYERILTEEPTQQFDVGRLPT